MKEHHDRLAWENDYSKRGRLWGGAVTDLPDLPAGSNVLELGCGSGKTMSAMIRNGWQVTGVDFSAPACVMCRQAVGLEANDVAVADARELPFRDQVFDAVFAAHVLGHLSAGGRIQIVSEISRVLKKSGLLFFRAFSTGDFRFGTGTEIEPGTYMRGTGIQTHYFGKEEVDYLLSELVPVSRETHRWIMRVRGQDYNREEIIAVFTRS